MSFSFASCQGILDQYEGQTLTGLGLRDPLGAVPGSLLIMLGADIDGKFEMTTMLYDPVQPPYWAVSPPSMTRLLPVMKDGRSEQIHWTAPGDLLGLPDTTDRMHLAELLHREPKIRGDLIRHVRVDDGRAHCVHAQAAAGVFQGRTLREADDGVVGCRVRCDSAA